MSPVSAALDAIRQDEYVGENRCVPCTVVNAAIALGLAAVAWVVLAPAVGLLVLAASAAAIGLRGYLVPGTPSLTKRYLPDRVLARFDKAPVSGPPSGSGGAGGADGVDVERVLVETGILTPCADEDDLCLDDGFRAAWRSAMDEVDAGRGSTPDTDAEDATTTADTTTTDDPTVGAVARLLDVDAAALSLRERGPNALVATHDGDRVAQWESRAALVADAAAADLVAERDPEWASRSVSARGEVLGGLRLFLETCPACGGPVTLGRETVESCCRSREVVAVACDDCESRLFEADFTG